MSLKIKGILLIILTAVLAMCVVSIMRSGNDKGEDAVDKGNYKYYLVDDSSEPDDIMMFFY